MTTDLCALTATALLEGYRKQTLSPVEVTQAVLKRIHEVNPRLYFEDVRQ
jgi:Asp-tRNA(Asn)/Glu-tRNA(Gln) amidotransferase A subunit family amidase